MNECQAVPLPWVRQRGGNWMSRAEGNEEIVRGKLQRRIWPFSVGCLHHTIFVVGSSQLYPISTRNISSARMVSTPRPARENRIRVVNAKRSLEGFSCWC